MNKKTIVRLSVFAFACGLFFSAAAQKQSAKDDLTQMVATERAFSRMSEEKGTREAFGAFIAEDGILFRPRAVLGKKWMQEHPLPPSQTRPLLTWEPVFAAISRSGDLGYTTGRCVTDLVNRLGAKQVIDRQQYIARGINVIVL